MSHVTTDIEAAATALRDGKLVAFATETVYGLGGDATNGKAVAGIFEAKGRPSFNPLIIHVASLEEAEKLGRFNDMARKLATALWPGALTLVVPRLPDCPVSKLASAGLGSIAVRVPAHPLAQQLLQLTGRPVAAPSANISGQISPTTASHVTAGLGDSIWGVLDGGPCEIGLESTIVSCLGDEPVILRPGGVTQQQLSDILGQEIKAQLGSTNDPISPGQLESHYAPKAQVRLNIKEPEPGEAYLAFGKKEPEAFIIRNLSPQKDLREAAANLFAMLHTLDMLGADSIAVAAIPEEGLGIAINDPVETCCCTARVRMNQELIEKFTKIVGEPHALTSSDEIAPHLLEPRAKFSGTSPLVLKPASTGEVGAILKLANETGTAIVPQGGNTGLVGGQMPLAK